MPLPNQQMNLVLSSDAKPRLKWTPELHLRFVDAINQLGGPEKATPKSLMRIMAIHGLTLYHLKSHLQKYRLGRSQQSQTYHHNKEEGMNSDSGENQRSNSMKKKCNAEEEKINDAKVAEALEMQMDVQRKLQQQIEVQRHLQLRIEAQGKYLQSVLKKAQETLSGYSACSIEVEHARAQLSQLASMVDSGCTTSSFSVITQSEGSMLKDAGEKLLGHSLESSLTSWESSDEEMNRVGKRSKSAVEETGESRVKKKNIDLNIDLNELDSGWESSDEEMNRVGKRSKSAVEETGESRVKKKKKKKKKKNIELNELDSGPTGIDLNCNALQLFGSTF